MHRSRKYRRYSVPAGAERRRRVRERQTVVGVGRAHRRIRIRRIDQDDAFLRRIRIYDKVNGKKGSFKNLADVTGD